LTLLAAITACSGNLSGGGPPQTIAAESAQTEVLTTTPDSIPAWVFADSNLVRDDTLITGVFPRGVVLAGFTPSASPRDLAALLDSVGVEVIGGRPLPPIVRKVAGERSGYYFLALRGDRSTARMREVVRRLSASPLVAIAFIDFQLSDQ
jgi:hypothetical protein